MSRFTGVSVIGAGLMGSALARAFIAQGIPTSLWNRTPAKLQPLAALGGRVAATPQEAIAASDIVVLILGDYAVTDDLLRSQDVARALRGKTLVQLASGSPRQAHDLLAWATRNETGYLDGAIMATPNIIGTPGASVLYSGSREVFERCEPTLRALGGSALYVGADVGHASALDSALLVVMWGTMFGALQAATICRSVGLDLAAYRDFLQPFLGHISGWVMEDLKRIEHDRLAADAATLATLGTHNRALQCLLDLCRERNLHRELPDALDRLFQIAIKAGHANDEFAVLSQFMR